MGKHPWLALALAIVAPAALAQTNHPTTPANETRTPAAIRSPRSSGDDLKVPLCPARFHDSLAGNGIAGPHQQGVTRPSLKSTVPALITLAAIKASRASHIGNFVVLLNVLVDPQGKPAQLCLAKSSGYGLDGAAAAAVQDYRFHPAMKAGKPVKMRVPIEVQFAAETPPEAPGSLPPR